MDGIHCDVLRRKLVYLIDNLNVFAIVPHLYGGKVLTKDDIDRLEAEVIESSRVRVLMIHMLPRKGPNAYQTLMMALKETDQTHVHDMLQCEEMTVQREQQIKDEDDQISKWLRKRVSTSRDTAGISVEELHKLIVQHCPVRLHGDRNLTPEDVLSMMKALLPQAVVVDEAELLNSVVHVELVTCDSSNSVNSEPTVEKLAVSSTDCLVTPMENWTVDQVCQWLEKIDCHHLCPIFQEENVRGYALVKSNYEELKDLGLKYGDRKTVLGKRDDYLQQTLDKRVAGESNRGPARHAAEDEVEVCAVVPDRGSGGGSERTVVQPVERLALLDQIGHDSTPAHSPSSAAPPEVPNVVIRGCKFESFDGHIPIFEDRMQDCIGQDRTVQGCSGDLPETSGMTDFLLTTSECTIELKEDESPPPSEVLRKFDTPVDVTFKYLRNATLSCVESRPGGNFLLPIHRFVMAELALEEGLLAFARESVMFIAACLNERANGTIHFGIAPKSGDQPVSCGGEIVGTRLRNDSKQKYSDFLTKALSKCFFEDQIECVQNCVRNPVFIEVVPRQGACTFVVEIDVIASHTWCEDLAFYAKLPTSVKDQFDNKALYRIVDGRPRPLVSEEVEMFMRIKGKLAENRKNQEESDRLNGVRDVDVSRDLSKKLIHLLCDGEDSFSGDHYPILVINAPDEHMNDEWLNENLSFLCDIEWKAVFDFDSEARICKYFQSRDEMMKIIMSEEFNERALINVHNPDHLHQLQEDIRNSARPPWVFVNGYGDEAMLSPVQWNREKSYGFKEAVRFFKSEIPQNRATVVFMLFSKDTAVVLDAADEFLTCFPDQWMCVAETENIGKPWAEEQLRRNRIESMDERFVIGMPWSHVRETVAKVKSPKARTACDLPTSTGAVVELKVSTRNEWTDLDILSYMECDGIYELANQQQRERLKTEAEIAFYRGEVPSWWNYYFQNQVCRREIYDELYRTVSNTLNSRCEDCFVEQVSIYHQPGAGGTTLARHILWSFRKSHRVAVVKNITEHLTAEQIIKFYQYNDNQPRPVLLLLDNPEEEKANLLLGELDEMTKSLKKHGGKQMFPVCVFLVCLRRTAMSKPHHTSKSNKKFDPKRVQLKHELVEREKDWFREKSKALQKQYSKKDALHMDPRLLISFNIMKENFNGAFIQRMVKDFVGEILDADERKLLKYVSLVNAFDLDFRPLPSAAFDGMMVKLPWQPGPRHGHKAILNRWETKLSDSIHILMNESSRTALGYIHSMRITNPLLSKEILCVLLGSAGGGSATIGDIALEFLGCNDIFGVRSIARDNLLKIVKDLLKQRGRLPNGLPETDFSPLIQIITDNESYDKASRVLVRGFELTQDPFIAQQIARLFIKSQNWDKAITFAKNAIELKPDSSCLWDTFGRIYEKQLVEEYTKLVNSDHHVPVLELVPVVLLGLKGLDMFRKVQSTSDLERTSIPNNAGFFGELQMIVCLLDCLSYAECFDGVSDVRHFLLDESHVPGDLCILADVDGRNCLEELKTLNQNVDKATNRIEDELVQLRADMVVDSKRKLNRHAEESLLRLKENLNLYFGAETDKPPTNLDPYGQCEYRRRRIFRLAGTNLKSIFDLRWTTSGEGDLSRVFDLAYENVQSLYANAYDYWTVISVNLALLSISPTYLYNRRINFDDMVEWSKKLYEMRETMHAPHLEPYLFLTMFNWPRNNTKHKLTPRTIETALRQWKEAYYKKYPRQNDDSKPYRKKDTTLFFLANGSDMASIYTMFEERGPRENRDVSFWRKADTLRTLQRFKGRLSTGGLHVGVPLHDGQENKSTISIATSMPIWDRSLWNRDVFFTIGFSWIGPKAFDITLDDPTLEADMSEDHHVMNPVVQREIYSNSRRRMNDELTQQQFNNELADLTTQLKQIEELKKTHRQFNFKESQLLRNEWALKQRYEKLLMRRRTAMESRIPEFR